MYRKGSASLWRTLGALALALAAGTVGLFRLQAVPSSPDGTLRRVHVPILMYHYISIPRADADVFRLDLSVTPSNFQAQMKWLKEQGYTTITPDDLVAALTQGQKLPNRPILLTFDDGYEDAYTNALPILKEFGFTGTFFIVTRFVDENRNGYLTWKQVKGMSSDGMSIQNHSRRHYDMRGRTRDWLLYEIVGPLQTIEAQTGVRPRFFCYPSGQYDLETIRTLQSVGVVAAFTTENGADAYTDDMLRLPRIRIRGSTSLAQFGRLITGTQDTGK